MLEIILHGAMLIAVTTFVHGSITGGIVLGIRRVHIEHWVQTNRWTQGTFQAGLVALLFLASVVEAALWALVYWHAEVIETFEKAMYFSVVTYTTLGYGDVTLPEKWRVLGAFQSAAGILMFGWSTAIIVAAVQKIYFQRRMIDDPSGSGPLG